MNNFSCEIIAQLDEDRKLSSKSKRMKRIRIIRTMIDSLNYNRASSPNEVGFS